MTCGTPFHSHVFTLEKWTYVHKNTCTSFTHHGQTLETTKCPSISEWKNYIAYIAIEPNSGILCSNEKELSTDICSNMDKSQNILLSKRSQTQKTIYCMIPFIWNSRTDKTSDRNPHSGCLAGQEGKECVWLEGHNRIFWEEGNVPYVHWVTVAPLTVCSFYCKLYLSKVLGENIWVLAFVLNLHGY